MIGLDELARRLLTLPTPSAPDLADGTAGHALVHAMLAPHVADGAAHRHRSRELLVATLDRLDDVEAGLWNGLAGIGWVLEALREPDEDPNADLDDLLVAAAEDWPADGNLDWLAGLSGLALYASVRPRGGEILSPLVDHLAARAESVPGGVAWCMDPTWHAASGSSRYDFGVAHGQPGVLVALRLAAQAGVRGTDDLLVAGVGGFLPLIADGVPHRAGGPPGRPDAWCYGPLGVGAVLAGLGRPGWADIGRSIATVASGSVTDVCEGLCHGPASALVMRRALGRAVVDRNGIGAGALPPGPGLLDGLAGVALALAPDSERWLPLLGVLSGAAGGSIPLSPTRPPTPGRGRTTP